MKTVDELVRKAGWSDIAAPVTREQIARFAAVVAEECAKIADSDFTGFEAASGSLGEKMRQAFPPPN